ncbi:4-hydroxy-tetrahydrodipicolinate reductase [bacterium]|nr:4-hydroxy-tetrahydrodipicolinate reductase [bacterium]
MASPIRILINGARGRMGQETVKAVTNDKELTLAAQSDMGDDLEKAITDNKIDIVVDFTAPDVALKNVDTIIASPAGGVIGTTGFTTSQIDELTKKCENKTPAVIIAPNFAIGAILLMHCSQIIAKYMPNVEIIELHHDKKLDAPSGTAVKTADLIAKSNQNTQVDSSNFESGPKGELHSGIPVHSVRLPGLLAHQEVIFGEEGQTLTLRHDSINRTCFMPGVLMACKEAIKREGLIYGLEKILF